MNRTSIEWCDFTWNPIRAKRIHAEADRDLRPGTFCTRISPGCANCYASVINRRFGNGLEYTVPNLEKMEFYIDEKILEEPLRRKKPARIFVGDMFDLFHEAIPIVFVGRVFGMMAKCPHHTFQVLTKRAKYMQSILSRVVKHNDEYIHWPMPHVWTGVSVEDQKRADERIPLLCQTPAALRFLSVEPMLEEVNVTPWVHRLNDGACPRCINWVICGGESGPGARPFNLAWAESLLAQCRAAGVPCFMKQIGSRPQVYSCRGVMGRIAPSAMSRCWREDIRQRDRKGGDPSEWPKLLRVREFPKQKVEGVA